MLTIRYDYGEKEEIILGKPYYFGELWDGIGDGEEFLKRGTITIDDVFVDFEVIQENTDILKSIIRVIGIY